MDNNHTSIEEIRRLTEENKVESDNKKKKKKKINFKKEKNYDFENKTNKKIHKLENKKRRKKIRKYILLGILFIFIAFVGYLFKTFYPEYKKIKEEVYSKISNMDEDTFKRAGNTVIYDKDNNVIAQYGNEKYEYVEYNDISQYITNGYIAKEDKNFSIHNGVDYKAIARATWSYIKNKGEITQGGSTITQQVVKNNLLNNEQTFKRKITEALCARSLEKQYNKNQIMEFYCNSNYYGNGCYGVEGACQFYFGKSAKDVSLSEAAMIVATSNLPNVYNPVADYELCLDKRDSVLYEMFNQDFITEEEYHSAVDERPVIVQKSENVIMNNFLSSYALHSATIKVMELNGFEFKYTFGSQAEYEDYANCFNEEYNKTYDSIIIGGYKIYTSLDQDIQKKLQKHIDDNLIEFTEKNEDGLYELQSAAVCIDNNSNMVVAIVGGRNDAGYFNRGYQAKRQSGSSIKPLLDYGPAINEGYVLPGSMVEDKKIDYNGYVPQNANGKYIGNVSVRKAILYSINTVAVQLYMDTGADKALSYLDKMKFSSLAYADSLAPSLSVGGFTNGVTVVDMAKGYNTIENEGKYSNASCIVSMSNYDDTIDYIYKEEEYEVFSPDTAFILTDMMQQTFEEDEGSGKKYKTSDQIYVGKTGTTNDTKDVWFCGYSKYFTTAVWIGYDIPKPMTDITSGTYPTKIFTDFMEDIHSNLSPKEFNVPDGIMLQDSAGNRKEVDYKSDIYHSRPDGYDYCSKNLDEKVVIHQKEKAEEEAEADAELAVQEFELFQITNTDEAKLLEENYNYAYEKVILVSESGKRESLMNRLAYKYDLLNGEVKEKWDKAIEEEDKANQEMLDSDNALKAQESIEKAEKSKKDTIITTAEWYISTLNNRTIYTDYVEELIEDGKTAIDNASVYTEYDDLYERFIKAVEYARKLPTETIDSTGDTTETTTEEN